MTANLSSKMDLMKLSTLGTTNGAKNSDYMSDISSKPVSERRFEGQPARVSLGDNKSRMAQIDSGMLNMRKKIEHIRQKSH